MQRRALVGTATVSTLAALGGCLGSFSGCRSTGTVADGGDAEVKVPSNGLKMNETFEIRADSRTTFTADFTPVKRGQTASYNIQPVSNQVTVTYEDDGATTETTSGITTTD